MARAASGVRIGLAFFPQPCSGPSTSDQIGVNGTAGELQRRRFVPQEIVTGGKTEIESQKWHNVQIAETNFEPQQQRVINDIRKRSHRTLVAQRIIEIRRQLAANGKTTQTPERC